MTSAEAERGIVLKTTPLRESDLVVSIYTESLGRISAIARGARKSQRRFAGVLQMLVLAKFHLGRRPRGELWGLDGGEVEREWTRLASDVAAHAHASYANELVAELIPSESPEPSVLELVVGLWDNLATVGASPAALRIFEMALLEVIGQRPAIDACAACGETNLETGTVFDPNRGGAICKACAATSRGPGVRPFAPETRAYLDAPDDKQFSSEARVAAREAMVATIVALVGHPLRSLEYIAKLQRSRS